MERVETGGIGRIVRFSASDGIRLNGALFGDARSKSCVVFVHGMGSDLFTNVSFALASRRPGGLAFFAFNNRGHGSVSSFSRFSGKRRIRLKAGTDFERFEDSIHDIRGAIDALAGLGFGRFVLCGHSTGCQKITYYQYKTRDRRIKALILLGAADDYMIYRKELGRRFGKISLLCRKMIGSGRGNKVVLDSVGFSAQRLDSAINLDRAEARIFNYGGQLREFGSIMIPVLAVFGSREEYAFMPAMKYLKILESKTSSAEYGGAVIRGANHSFYGHGNSLARLVYRWTLRVLGTQKTL